jgi:copper chaperone CopZ
MMNRTAVSLAALATAAVLLMGTQFAGPAVSSAIADEAVASADAHDYVLAIEGMSCAIGCPPAIESMLEGIHGVTGVSVDFETQSAKVSVSGGHQLSSEACSKALENSGYSVASISPAD